VSFSAKVGNKKYAILWVFFSLCPHHVLRTLYYFNLLFSIKNSLWHLYYFKAPNPLIFSVVNSLQFMVIGSSILVNLNRAFHCCLWKVSEYYKFITWNLCHNAKTFDITRSLYITRFILYCFVHSDITKFYFVLLGQGFGQQLLHQYVIYVIQI
jgi:hypothetical protein